MFSPSSPASNIARAVENASGFMRSKEATAQDLLFNELIYFSINSNDIRIDNYHKK